jgi:hypothetical protein
MTALAHHPHPVAAAVASARAALAEVAATSLWSMDATQTVSALDEVEACEAQLRQVKSRLLVHAEQV